MNFLKRSVAGEGTRGEVGASRGVGASLLPTSDLLPWVPASSSCSFRSAERLTQGVRRVVRDLEAIVKEGGLNVILPKGLADPLGMELLEL